MYTIGHRLYHEIIPLPRFENEDTGFYYFLAQISLRKLVCDTLDVVGYHGTYGINQEDPAILFLLDDKRAHTTQ